MSEAEFYCNNKDCILRQNYEVKNYEVIYNAIIYFGKHKGKRLQELPLDYQQWINSHFDDGILKRWIKICLHNGKYTTPMKDESKC